MSRIPEVAWPSLEGDAKRRQLARWTLMAFWYSMVFHPLPPEDPINVKSNDNCIIQLRLI